MKFKIKAYITLVVSCFLIFGGAGTIAFAGGSDSPTPYTVDSTGITLPSGVTFPDNGHVNLNTDVPHVNMHFESKCIVRTDYECTGMLHDQAQFIGKSFIPWSAFGLTSPFCVTWVQISLYNEHFGEGGQSPVCLGGTPTPIPTESPTPAPTPTQTSTPTPTPTVTPTSSPTPTDSPIPSPSSTLVGSVVTTLPATGLNSQEVGYVLIGAGVGLILGLLAFSINRWVRRKK